MSPVSGSTVRVRGANEPNPGPLATQKVVGSIPSSALSVSPPREDAA